MNQLKALFLFILLACSLNITAQRIKGSDTVLPVSQETAEIFMKDDPDRRVTVTGGGTGVGISALMDNTTDIAMASRPIKFSEKMKLKAVFSPITASVPLQLLAREVAIQRGCDVDQPRNLAKSVTVE